MNILFCITEADGETNKTVKSQMQARDGFIILGSYFSLYFWKLNQLNLLQNTTKG